MACVSPAVVCGRKDLAKAREFRKEGLFLQGEKWERYF